MINVGKNFEERFKEDFSRIPNSLVIRIPDQMSGYKASSNICDFICYVYPNIFLIECKSHAGASIPFANISQYDKLKMKIGIKGVRVGVVLWLYEKDKVFYIPASTIKCMKEEGKKSVGLKAVEEGYNIIEIPSTKLRTYMKSDYSILAMLEEGM